jgi:hypothetical protein
MAKASLSDDPRPRLRAAIVRLYRQLEALPTTDRPTGSRRSGWSPAYTALMIEIRGLVDQYNAITDEG